MRRDKPGEWDDECLSVPFDIVAMTVADVREEQGDQQMLEHDTSPTRPIRSPVVDNYSLDDFDALATDYGDDVSGLVAGTEVDRLNLSKYAEQQAQVQAAQQSDEETDGTVSRSRAMRSHSARARAIMRSAIDEPTGLTAWGVQ